MYDIVIGRQQGDLQKYGKRGTILIGKHYVKMGQSTSLSNNIYLDIASAHVVSIFGKRGGGKCLTGDTTIQMADGSIKTIKELENNRETIASLNSDLKIESAKNSHFYKRTVDKILKVELRSGKELSLTPEHPLLTVKGWLPAGELNVGSRIATPRILPFFGESLYTESEVKILAYLYTEGHVKNNFILFTNKDDKIVSDFKQSVRLFDDNLEINRKYTAYYI